MSYARAAVRFGFSRPGVFVTVCFTALATLSGSPDRASAQPKTERTIKFIVPTTAGSPLDVLARLVANRLSVDNGHTVIVEDRAGAGTTIGSKTVAIANPDGNTLLFTSVSHAVSAAMYKHLDYDPVKSFAPVAVVANSSWVLVVSPTLPVKTLSEFIAYAKSHPDELNFGFGVGTAPHLLGELFKTQTGTKIASIPYKGGAQAQADILAGQVHMNFGTTATLLPLIADGKLRALAVTSKTRSPDLPDVPTLEESGFPALSRGFWLGVLGPAGMPKETIATLNREINMSVAPADVRATMKNLGFDPETGTPEDFGRLLTDDVETWSGVVKAAGLTPN